MNAHLGDKYSQANRYANGIYDCSSFVYRAFEAAGVKLVHKDTGQRVDTAAYEVYAKGFKLLWPATYAQVGKNLPSNPGLLSSLGVRPGDLIFYSFKRGTRFNNVTHVGTVNYDGGIIHARNPTKGVTKDPISYGATSVCAVLRYPEAGVSSAPSSGGKAITETVVIGGGKVSRETPALINFSTGNTGIELLIQNGQTIYAPVVEGDITWETERKGSPGRLTFNVVKDSALNFTEGNAVRLTIKGAKIFFGFVFSKKSNKEETISVTAYDQLRYLKNKETYVYANKTATQLIKMIASDFALNVGSLENTAWKIPSRVEDNKTLFDIIQTALDLTLQNKKKLYILYDDFGKLTLKNVTSMKLPVLIDEETGENYDYTSSIDGETYNKIKLSYTNEEAGKREIYIAQDSANINRWGLLQYFESIDENVNGKAKADALLALYNKRARNLSVSGAFGDVRVRAGCTVPVKLNLGDIKIQNFMLVEKVKHIFNADQHTMDLTLRGGEFVA